MVPAAGRGERLGSGAPKALRMLGGVPLLVHAVRALAQARSVDLVVVAAPPDDIAEVRALLADQEFSVEVIVVAGGGVRRQSVRFALASLPSDVEVVLVHDAARPLVPVDLVDAVAAAVRGGAEAVVPALPLADTVKEVAPAPAEPGGNGSGATGLQVTRTVDRAVLRAAQTPQGFRRTVLEAAHAEGEHHGGAVATDDAGLVEMLGRTVQVIPGSEEAFKVTRPLDLLAAEALLTHRRANSATGEPTVSERANSV